ACAGAAGAVDCCGDVADADDDAGAAIPPAGITYVRPAMIMLEFCCNVGLAATIASRFALVLAPIAFAAIFERLSPGSALYCFAPGGSATASVAGLVSDFA